MHDQLIAARNGNPPWSKKPVLWKVVDIAHHDVVSAGTVAHEFGDKHPWEWTKKDSTTLEDATEAYMVEVIAECDI